MKKHPVLLAQTQLEISRQKYLFLVAINATEDVPTSQ